MHLIKHNLYGIAVTIIIIIEILPQAQGCMVVQPGRNPPASSETMHVYYNPTEEQTLQTPFNKTLSDQLFLIQINTLFSVFNNQNIQKHASIVEEANTQ